MDRALQQRLQVSLETRAHSHLNLARTVALCFGGTPIRRTLEAEAGLGKIKMVHYVREDSRELHAYLFVDNEPLLDAHIQVEVSQAADPASTAAPAVEAEDQRPYIAIDRNRITEEVDVALRGGSHRNAVRIGTPRDIAVGLRTTNGRR